MADTRLVDAIMAGDSDAASALLASEPDLADECTPDGQSALVLACYHRMTELIEPLMAARSCLDWFEAAIVGAEIWMGELLHAGADVNARASDGFTALHLACFFGHERVVDMLLDAGADANIEACHPSRVRPIHSAVARQSTVITRVLLGAGADPNVQQAGGHTPLHAAARHGHHELVRLLLDAGADPRRRADSGQTAADFAAHTGHVIPGISA